MTAVYDSEGRFVGHEPNEGCEHRTVGSHRAWCLSCSEWCYPNIPCVRCERAIGERVADDDLSLGDPERRRILDDLSIVEDVVDGLEVQVNLDGSVEFVPTGGQPRRPVVVRGEPGWERRVLELVRQGEPFSVVCYPES